MYRYYFGNFVSECELTREEALLNSSEFMISHQEENAKTEGVSIELYDNFVIVVVCVPFIAQGETSCIK